MTDDIQKLLDKYWAGESSLEDEQALKDHFSGNDNHDELTPLFSYLNSEKDNTYNFEPDLSFTKDKAKVRYLLPKIIGIAASLVLLFTLSTGTFNSTDQSYKNKYTEVEDPEEALEIGRTEYRAALNRIASSIQSGKWAGHNNDEISEISLPQWVLNREGV